jgi:hypothetical protein
MKAVLIVNGSRYFTLPTHEGAATLLMYLGEGPADKTIEEPFSYKTFYDFGTKRSYGTHESDIEKDFLIKIT